jgi:hypothetical protein
MSAAFYEISDMEQGADWSLLLSIQNADGTPTNLSGCLLKMQIRSTYGADPVATLSTTSGGIVITSASNGNVTISMSAAQLAAIPAGNYLYDLKLTDGTGKTARTIQGGALISPQVTI